ncbi:di-trans,poly-cis-decaprenylcistransferase [Candidatus Woesearchaeota archaeon]|nr:di-trans,poly-cis-decaprenylcistransferase [Candidatus Woesearchaeota archaeon]
MPPGHVAIILDGNRRYAKKLGMNRLKGHEYGAKKLIEVLGWLKDAGVREVTLYTLSTENLKRSAVEINALFMLFSESIKKAKNDSRLKDTGTRVRFIGNLSLLPMQLQNEMADLQEITKSQKRMTVNFAIAYGGRTEIVEAAKRIAIEAKKGNEPEISEDTFSSYLYLSSEPDLLIRPGGEKRLSNFLLWQLAYTELIFIDKLFPELEKEDIMQCLAEYEVRERRMGK